MTKPQELPGAITILGLGAWAIPKDAEIAVLQQDKVFFYTLKNGRVFRITETTSEETLWESLTHIKSAIICNGYKADVIWERPTASNPKPVKPVPRNASNIVDAALQHIKDRATTYDSPEGERSALKTAQAFNAITGKDLTEAEVFLLLQILKDVRQWQKGIPHQDSLEDCIAYAALKAEALER